MRNKLLARLSLLAFLVVGTLVAKYFILSRASIPLEQYNPMSWTISQSLRSSSNGYVPIEGVNYSVGNLRYFDNRQWVVAGILPINNSQNPETIILKTQGTSYKVVLGPGSSFVGDNFTGIPSDVVDYINPVSK